MTLKKLVLFFCSMLCQFILAQNDTIKLKEVVVADGQLHQFSNTIQLTTLNDSVIKNNKNSLTALLNYNSTIYFKENGFGMVASPSFRGTTAQQTAVIWNGININSTFNGQTDFNTITTSNYNSIVIRFSGGSSIYGSSAIGGSIHLNNELVFKNLFSNEVLVNYGSFNTINANYKMVASTDKLSSQVSLSRNSSTNDYKFIDKENQKNQNGQYYNTSLNANFGYKINEANFLKFFTETFEAERHFSGTIASNSKSKYQDLNSKNLVQWDSNFNRFESKMKVAFLTEKYKYFENFNSDIFESSKAETTIAKYELGFKFNPMTSVNAIVDYTNTIGSGNNISSNKRSIYSASLLFKHQVLNKLSYEFSTRKEVTNTYDSPFLFSVGTNYIPSKLYEVKVNVSRNFRIPTFNDLYWNGLGNVNLKPETANQIEISQIVKYKNFEIIGAAYYIKIKDLIQWKPTAQNSNWTPNNIASVSSYGVEVSTKFTKKFDKNCINWHANYAYSVSKDDYLNKQLIYVPFHKLNSSIGYSIKKLTINYQFLYTGYVYTSTDNYYFLKSYQVSNLATSYDFGKIKQYKIGFSIFNILNENYQSVSQRPMPGRNYSLNLNLNF